MDPHQNVIARGVATPRRRATAEEKRCFRTVELPFVRTHHNGRHHLSSQTTSLWSRTTVVAALTHVLGHGTE
jgi:hypothetical protein